VSPAFRLWQVVGLASLLAGGTLVAPVDAQSRSNNAFERALTREREAALLRDAAAMEARGDYAGAEQVLRSVLEQAPTSTGALVAMERALRAQNRTRDMLQHIDRMLAIDPRASQAWATKLRLLVEVDSLASLEQEAQSWMRADPGSPDPYRELARMYERAYGAARAVELLQAGRTRVGDSAAFAAELGDLLQRTQQPEAAAQEWARAVGDNGDQLAVVMRRVALLDPESSRVPVLLLRALDSEPTTTGRRRAAVRIALELELVDEALDLARRVAPALPSAERRIFLQEMARRGEDVPAPRLSVWAYETMREGTSDASELTTLEGRIAAASLASGDSAGALTALNRQADRLSQGSNERRHVVVDAIRLEASRGEAGALTARLASFRREFPDAPELDELASVVALGLQSRGLSQEAAAVLEDVLGPRSSLERAYLHLERGDVEAGVAALQESLAALPPATATEVIQLVSLLDRVAPPAAKVVARAAVLEHRGAQREALEQLTTELESLPASDQPALLSHAARLADSTGSAELGIQLRQRLVDQHPDAAELPDAVLMLSRARARAGQVPEAIALLEKLILDRPSSPVVPAARRELDRLKGRTAGDGT
jgi:tetratricopeptide (TPR) repeat protein